MLSCTARVEPSLRHGFDPAPPLTFPSARLVASVEESFPGRFDYGRRSRLGGVQAHSCGVGYEQEPVIRRGGMRSDVFKASTRCVGLIQTCLRRRKHRQSARR